MASVRVFGWFGAAAFTGVSLVFSVGKPQTRCWRLSFGLVPILRLAPFRVQPGRGRLYSIALAVLP